MLKSKTLLSNFKNNKSFSKLFNNNISKENFLTKNLISIPRKNSNFKNFQEKNQIKKNEIISPYKKNFSLKNFYEKDPMEEKGLEIYQEMMRQSISDSDRRDFWLKESQEISWFKKPEIILDEENKPFYKWFADGEVNMTYNCVDRHIENGKGDSIAFIWESAYLNKVINITYKELDEEIKKICKIFIANKLEKGDRVVLYMPMIPEALFSALACAKLGLVHCIVFGGFAADELANRVNHCSPKMIVTASAGIEPKAKIPYLPIVKESLKLVEKPGNFFFEVFF